MSDHQTNLIHLLEGAGLTLLNLLITIGLGLVLAPYIAQTLGDRLYGINYFVGTFVGCFAILDFGIDSAVSRYFVLHFSKGERKECVDIANTAFYLFIGIGTVGFVLMSLIGWGIFVLNPNMEDRELFLLVILIHALVFALNFPLRALHGIINGTMRQDLTASREVFFKIFGATLSFLVLYVSSGGRVGLIGLACVGLVIVFLDIFVLYRLVYKVFPDFVFSPSFYQQELLRKLLSFGSYTFLVFVGDTLSTKGAIFVLSAMLSFEATTPYALVSVNLSTYYFGVMTTIGGGWLITWFTYLHANGEKELLAMSMRFSYKICAYSASFMLFGLLVWSPDFIVRWVGEDYLIAYPSLVLLSLFVWISQIQAPNTKLLFALAKHSVLSYLTLVGGILNVTLSVVLVWYGWGMNGVAFSAFLIETIVRGIVIPIYVRHLLNENIVVYYLRLLFYVTIAAIAWIVPAIISWALLAPNYPRLFLVGGLSVLTYVPVIYFLGFNAKERAELQKRLRRSR